MADNNPERVERPNPGCQEPAEGSREIIERELQRKSGTAKEPGESGAPGSAGRTQQLSTKR